MPLHFDMRMLGTITYASSKANGDEAKFISPDNKLTKKNEEGSYA
ncbi:hypothetical protein PR003_g21527 [Phytophthora rubi]|uniref:Uncharacterized protein n=1 Tax=Phytophthora rubi TaxID=129364 RepID=A0A6A3JDC0_9STRA|nr:hypothetical protein PR002_g21403 [Phytophthora rubi]KAE8995145.1 hypothetical protein PR001_g20199 [Phytophthora rubi]KAE9305327.1 hypothetical protein PR003_g21527 [Phytophthora rubi]